MSFSLDVLVIDQEKPTKFPFLRSMDVQNEVDHADFIGRFFNTWPFMANTNGIWYSLLKEYPDDEEKVRNGYKGWIYKDGFYLVDTITQKDTDPLLIPYWIDNQDVIDNLEPCTIKQEFMVKFEKILRLLIRKSPVKTIMFLATFQAYRDDPSYEIIQGKIKLDKFIEMMKENKILFNVCYILIE